MDLDIIASNYELIGDSIIDRTAKYSRGIGNSSFRKMSDKINGVSERADKIFLRVGIEFLIKSIYLRDGINIFNLKKSKNWFGKIEDIGKSNLIIDRTIGLYYLLKNFGKLPSVPKETLTEIEDGLENIRLAGDPAVHSFELSEIEPEKVNLIRSRLSQILESQKRNI